MGERISQPNVHQGPRAGSIRFWLTLGATGIAAGLGGAALMSLLRAVQHAAWNYHGGDFLVAVMRASNPHRVITVLCAGVIVALGTIAIRRFFPPGPGLSAALWVHSGRLPAARMCANAVLSMVIVGLGASLGRESGPKEVGAAAGSVFARALRLTATESRVLAACGAGAGIAAVYNVPFGGAMFACEVLLGSVGFAVVIPALAVSAIATFVSWIALPDRPTYDVVSAATSSSLVLWSLLFGPVAGLISVGFIKVMAWAKARKLTGWRAAGAALLVFAVLGFASIPYPQLLGNGKNVVQLAVGNQIDIALVLALLVLKCILTAGCLATGAPGGLFTPTLMFGSLLGALVGFFWQALWPISEVGSYAVIGAAAVLAAATLGPLSAVAFILELTYHTEGLLVPIVIAVAGATATARSMTSRSIYAVDE